MNNENTRNTILALVLSVLVLLGWQYFIVGPRMAQEKAQSRSAAEHKNSDSPALTPAGAPRAGSAAPTLKARDAVLADSARVKIDTPALSGSINLRGGRIDDLILKNYRTEVAANSPNIVLFSPSGAERCLLRRNGLCHGQWRKRSTCRTGTRSGACVKGYALTPEMPIRLEYNNGQGLTFRRVYAVDNNYLFTVTDEVVNNRGEAVTLYPYALVSRHGLPQSSEYVCHSRRSDRVPRRERSS